MTILPPKSASLLPQAAKLLAAHRAPAISAYELARHVFVWADRLAIPPKQLKTVWADLCGKLSEVRLLTPIDPIAQTRGYLLFGNGDASAAGVMCSLDPFAYVSHLSAMEYHGLTDRFSKVLYMTRPTRTQWREQAQSRMAKDLGTRLQAYLDCGLPKLLPPTLERFGKTYVHFRERSHLGAFRLVEGSSLRVATIGRVFIEMIREPSLCGGMQHVADVYRREGKRYLQLIVDEVNQHGLAIDKVRAGFLLSEVGGLEHEVFAEWEKSAQRGGSQKLDPDEAYTPKFSKRWQLSINVPSISLGDDNE
jgi:predicted transcriptional regulator of viral defense system